MQSVGKLSSTKLVPGAKKVGDCCSRAPGVMTSVHLGGQNSTHNRVLHRLCFLDQGGYHILLVRPGCGSWGGFCLPLQVSFLLAFHSPLPAPCSAPRPSSPTPSFGPAEVTLSPWLTCHALEFPLGLLEFLQKKYEGVGLESLPLTFLDLLTRVINRKACNPYWLSLEAVWLWIALERAFQLKRTENLIQHQSHMISITWNITNRQI